MWKQDSLFHYYSTVSSLWDFHNTHRGFSFFEYFFFIANTFLLLHKCWTLVMKYFYLKGQFRKSVANFQSYEHHKWNSFAFYWGGGKNLRDECVKTWTDKTKTICGTVWPAKGFETLSALAQCEMKAVLWTVCIYSSSSHCPVTLSRDQSINGPQEGTFQLCEWMNRLCCIFLSTFLCRVSVSSQWSSGSACSV